VSGAAEALLFAGGALVSLGCSWVVVSRVERLGGRLGASEALLGLISALVADAPEITSAVSALSQHKGPVGAGVVIGSNVFNLAALLGLGSVVAGMISLHRRVVVLQGAVALFVALACLATVAGVLAPWIGLLAVLLVLVPYAGVAALDGSARPNPSRLRRALQMAIAEEELELRAALDARRARPRDVLVGAVGLVVVVVSSVVMERAATRLGARISMAGIVEGGVVLAAVTSLPNAVAALYWARRGRGVATLSTALNSNALNVAAGFLVPAILLGPGPRTGTESFVAVWYASLTALVLVIAYVRRGVPRAAGWLVVGAYLVFVALLVVLA